jgi:hypothetical protein
VGSDNAREILFFLAVVIIAGIVLVKTGAVSIRTRHVRIGRAEAEREVIRRQVEAAHDFIMSIDGKIKADNSHYNCYFTKYILERVYDKAIEWIMFNHITNSTLYVQDKQDTICNLIYTFDVGADFKTPEFKNRVCNWVAELIDRLIKTREIYSKQGD